MKFPRSLRCAAAAVAVATLAGCAWMPGMGGWTTLVDGTQGLDNFNRVGETNGSAGDDANSGTFLRCQDPARITGENCYESNIFDQRPDPSYGTGAIVKVAKAPDPMLKAGGKWNTYEITALSTEGDSARLG